MIDVSQIDLDSLTTLELWELHERIAARLGPVSYYRGQEVCPATVSAHNTYAASQRMRSLL